MKRTRFHKLLIRNIRGLLGSFVPLDFDKRLAITRVPNKYVIRQTTFFNRRGASYIKVFNNFEENAFHAYVICFHMRVWQRNGAHDSSAVTVRDARSPNDEDRVSKIKTYKRKYSKEIFYLPVTIVKLSLRNEPSSLFLAFIVERATRLPTATHTGTYELLFIKPKLGT